MSKWQTWPADEQAEIREELDRAGFKPGDAFYVVRFDDDRIAAVFPDDGACSRPWGPERQIA